MRGLLQARAVRGGGQGRRVQLWATPRRLCWVCWPQGLIGAPQAAAASCPGGGHPEVMGRKLLSPESRAGRQAAAGPPRLPTTEATAPALPHRLDAPQKKRTEEEAAPPRPLTSTRRSSWYSPNSGSSSLSSSLKLGPRSAAAGPHSAAPLPALAPAEAEPEAERPAEAERKLLDAASPSSARCRPRLLGARKEPRPGGCRRASSSAAAAAASWAAMEASQRSKALGLYEARRAARRAQGGGQRHALLGKVGSGSAGPLSSGSKGQRAAPSPEPDTPASWPQAVAQGVWLASCYPLG